MQIKSVRRVTAVMEMALGAVPWTLSACGGSESGGASDGVPGAPPRAAPASRVAQPRPAVPVGGPIALPGVGERLHGEIPADSSQVLAVYGEGEDSSDSTVVLYVLQDDGWRPVGSWPAHNGRNGWSTDHYAGHERSPVGVFTLTDAGGVLPDPGTRLPYAQDEDACAPPYDWDSAHRHDFDYVIAIDHNRLRGVPPHDATRPRGAERGGGIWLHLDNGSGTSACISLSGEAMRFLLHTLDPDRDPVVVMGERRDPP
ncbi:L,D-transpeptidase family protein [Streptomyces sp. NPDC005917]|uniref:L,D-transpeptidase family protein n=1 Tax=unclassified Streptomyces TaxID=2593676 RepID=UPI0033C736A0